MKPDEALRSARRRAGITQRELGRQAGVPQSTIARIENGIIDPKASTLDALLRRCGDELVALPHLGIGVDRTLIASHLQLDPEERLERLAKSAEFIGRISGSARGREL